MVYLPLPTIPLCHNHTLILSSFANFHLQNTLLVQKSPAHPLMSQSLIKSCLKVECPNNCSGVGSCGSTGSCSCPDGFHGLDCSLYMKDMENGNNYSGTISPNSWIYYKFNISAFYNVLTVHLNATDLLYLYAKQGSVGGFETYDSMDSSSLSTLSFTALHSFDLPFYFAIWSDNHSPVSYSILSVASVECANNCSGVGECNKENGTCICGANYANPDCSLYIEKIENKKNNSGEITGNTWHFYQFDFSTFGNLLAVSLYDPSDSLLLYASPDTPPSFYKYSYKASGVGTKSLSIYDDASFTGSFYFAIWSSATLPISYSFYVAAEDVCQNDCSGFGTCSSGVCGCTDSHSGDDCSQVSTTLSGGSSKYSLGEGKWGYFEFTISDYNSITLQLTEVASNGFAALYSQLDHHPGRYDYYLKSADQTSVHTMTLINPSGSIAYFGVYALQNVTFDIALSPQRLCMNNCSNHGLCTNGTCQCNTGWTTQQDCSEFNVQLSGGTNYTESNRIVGGETHHFSLDVKSANQLLFDINTTMDVENKLHVYLKLASVPNPFDYFLQANVSNDFLRLDVPALTFEQMGVWFVTMMMDISGPTTDYVIQGFTLRICPNDCSSNGHCDAGVCICKPQYVGSDCSSQNIELTSKESSGVVTATQWNYYHTSVLGSNALHVRVKERNTYGKVWVYMKKQTGSSVSFPTQISYDYANKSDTKLHEIVVASVNATGTWYIGVFGSPYLGFDEDQAKYAIVAQLGCSDYKACNTCITDPNCGWCADDWSDPDKGYCAGGDPEKPFSDQCVAWFFSTCSRSKEQHKSAIVGVSIGISIGGAISILLIVIGFFFYKKRAKFFSKNKGFYSPFDVTIISDDEDKANDRAGRSLLSAHFKAPEESTPSSSQHSHSYKEHYLTFSPFQLNRFSETETDTDDIDDPIPLPPQIFGESPRGEEYSRREEGGEEWSGRDIEEYDPFNREEEKDSEDEWDSGTDQLPTPPPKLNHDSYNELTGYHSD